MADEITGPAAAAEAAPQAGTQAPSPQEGAAQAGRGSFADAIAAFRTTAAPAASDAGAPVEAGEPSTDGLPETGSDTTTHHSRLQPREDGRFAGPPVQPNPDEGGPSSDEPAGEQQAPGDGTGQDDQESTTDEAADGGEPEPYVVRLPGRNRDEPDEEIPIDGLTQAQKERLAQMRNGYLRGEEYRQARAVVDSAYEELVEMQAEFAADPVHFLSVNAVHPSMQVELARYLLANLYGTEEHWNEIADLTSAWGADPSARETFLRQMREQATERERHRPPPEARQHARLLTRTIASFVPEDAHPRDAERFMAYAEDEIIAAIQETRQAIDPRDKATVYTIIKRIADAFGYGQAAADAPPTPQPAAPRATVRRPAREPAPASPAAPEARAQGTKLVEASARRRELAVTPSGPVGGGAGAAPPKGFKERVAWLRGQG